MRAIQAEAPGPASVLREVELPIPEPGLGEARVRVAYCGINPLDVLARAGRVSYMVKRWPLIPGIEHSGIVDAVGEGVDAGLVGQRVISRYSFGGNAEYSIDVATDLVPLPEGMRFLEGAVYRGSSHTAWRVLNDRARAQAGQWALFHSAAGPVGIMLTQLAKRMGLRVIGIVGSADKAAFAKPFGADELIVVDSNAVDWIARVKAITGGRGVDLIVDGNGGEVGARNTEVLALNATLVFLGSASGSPPPPVQQPFLLSRNVTVAGFNLPITELSGRHYSEIDREIVPAILAGEIKVPITEVIALEAVPEYHRRFEERKVQGRVVIRVGGDLS